MLAEAKVVGARSDGKDVILQTYWRGMTFETAKGLSRLFSFSRKSKRTGTGPTTSTPTLKFGVVVVKCDASDMLTRTYINRPLRQGHSKFGVVVVSWRSGRELGRGRESLTSGFRVLAYGSARRAR